MFCKLLKSQRNILSKHLLNDIVRKKSFMQTLALAASKAIPYQTQNVDSPLKGKNVVYIGGYGGIGLAACKEMANKGIKNLTIMGCQNYLHMLEDLQSANKDLVVYFVNLNSKKDNQAIKAALNLSLEYMGHIDVLINSSTITSERKSIPKLDSDLVLKYPKNVSSFENFKKNLHKLHENIVETTNSAIPMMSQEYGGKGGVIVNVSSVFGLEPSTYALVYAAVKQDIIDTTRLFAQKFDENVTGITHMGICPGEYITYILSRHTPGVMESNKGYTVRRDTQCVKTIIDAIESGRNGSVWISEMGKLLEIKLNLVDNLGVAFINRLKSTLSRNEALATPNLYAFIASNNLLPPTQVSTNPIRNFSAKDDDKTGDCDSPYAECEPIASSHREIPKDSTKELTWNKIAATRKKAKDSTHKFFTQNEIVINPPCGTENPAFVLSYKGPKNYIPSTEKIKKIINATKEENPEVVAEEIKKLIYARNEIIKNREEVPIIADEEIKVNIANNVIKTNTADDAKASSQQEKVPPNVLSMAYQYYTNTDAAQPQQKKENEVTPAQLRIKTLPVVNNTSHPLEGKNVALFGGYYGVPLATCKEMAKKGIKNLVILGGNLSTRKELKLDNPDLNVNFIPIRSRRNDRTGIDYALNKTVESMGHIDVLVHGNKIRNCYCPKMAISNCLRCVIDTEFCAVPFMSREYGHKGGYIINLSSIVGLEPLPFPTIHTAIKRGIINFTRTFAHQNFSEKTGITHMAICPGENIMTTYGKLIDENKTKELFKARAETANVCGRAIVKAIEKGENGTVWIIDMDNEKQIKLRKIWDSSA